MDDGKIKLQLEPVEIVSLIKDITEGYLEQAKSAKSVEAEPKEQAKPEAKKAEAAKTEVQKKKDLQEILDMFATWCATYYNIDEVEFKSELSADQVLDLVNSLNDYVEALKNFESMFSIKPAAKPIGTKVIKSNTKPKSADEQISDFLNKMGW